MSESLIPLSLGAGFASTVASILEYLLVSCIIGFQITVCHGWVHLMGRAHVYALAAWEAGKVNM